MNARRTMCIFPTISHLYFRLFIWFNFLNYGFYCFVMINKIYNLNAETIQKIRLMYLQFKQVPLYAHCKIFFLPKLFWNNDVKMVFVKFEEIISGFNQLQKKLIFACYLARFVEYCQLWSCSLYLSLIIFVYLTKHVFYDYAIALLIVQGNFKNVRWLKLKMWVYSFAAK